MTRYRASPLLIFHCRTRLSQALIRQRTILVGTPTLRFLVEPWNFTLIPQHDSVLIKLYYRKVNLSTCQRPINSRTSGLIISRPHCGCMVILTLHLKFGMLSTFCCTSLGIMSAAGQNADVKLINTWTHPSSVTLTSYINPKL